jgi:hypothetical protein
MAVDIMEVTILVEAITMEGTILVEAITMEGTILAVIVLGGD